jgi:hypothetical protein
MTHTQNFLHLSNKKTANKTDIEMTEILELAFKRRAGKEKKGAKHQRDKYKTNRTMKPKSCYYQH